MNDHHQINDVIRNAYLSNVLASWSSALLKEVPIITVLDLSFYFLNTRTKLSNLRSICVSDHIPANRSIRGNNVHICGRPVSVLHRGDPDSPSRNLCHYLQLLAGESGRAVQQKAASMLGGRSLRAVLFRRQSPEFVSRNYHGRSVQKRPHRLVQLPKKGA